MFDSEALTPDMSLLLCFSLCDLTQMNKIISPRCSDYVLVLIETI